MTIPLRVYQSLAGVDRDEWSAVIAAAGAPAFYHYPFLHAYERTPLQPTSAFFYLVLGRPAVAVLPAYLQRTDDPLGQVAGLGLPAQVPGDLVLITHEAHCYDTSIPARPGTLTPALAERLRDELARLARQAGAKWFVLWNVAAGSPTAKVLAAAGLTATPTTTRFRRDVAAWPSVEDYVATLPSPKARAALRRSQRQAGERGMSLTAPDPARGAAASVELCRRVTARHGTAAYYPEQFRDFVARAAELITVTEVRLAGRLASAAICLTDPGRFHLWAGGVDYEVTAGIHSGFPLMLWPALAETIRTGRPVIEGGRGNETAKLRYGLEPVPLLAFWGQP